MRVIPKIFISLFFITAFLSSGCSKKEEVAAPADTLVLKNGGKIQCRIIRESTEKLIVQYQDGQVEFLRSEIQDILRGQELTGAKDGIEIQADRDSGKAIRNYPYVRTTDSAKCGQIINEWSYECRFANQIPEVTYHFDALHQYPSHPTSYCEAKIYRVNQAILRI